VYNPLKSLEGEKGIEPSSSACLDALGGLRVRDTGCWASFGGFSPALTLGSGTANAKLIF
jgi:hypothetical protein